MGMTLSDYRTANGLTLEALAAQLGKSKSHLCEIEKTSKASAKLAMAIERLTGGLVDAATLNDEIADARRAAA